MAEHFSPKKRGLHAGSGGSPRLDMGLFCMVQKIVLN